MSAKNYTIPNPCKHLVDYKLKHGLKGYDLIQDLLNCSPYGRTMIIKSKSEMPRCNFCSGCHGRLFMCLICSSVACSVNSESNHTLFHSESFTGHEIYVDMERAELFCSICCDQVYDPEFDKAVMCKHLDFGNGISGNSDLMLGNRKRLDFGNGVLGNSDLRLGKSKRLDFGNGVLGNSDLRLSKRKRLDFGCDLDLKSSKRLVLRRKKLSSKSCFPLGLRGLNNLGNTCFMNSVLQALFHAPPFRNYFLSDRHNHESCRKSSTDRLCLPCDVDVVFSAVFSGERTPYSPAKFLYSWWQHSENLASYEQQDAHEFFISMLDRIHEKLGKATMPIKENGDCQCIAHRVFSGLLRSDVICTSCGFTSSTYDPCLDISLDLNTSSSFTTNSTNTKSNKPNEALASSTLAGCLDLFTRPEKLGSKLFCEKCQQKQNALKQMSLKKLPQVLCLHIKRFEHSPTRKTSRKIDRHLKFPFSLDMGPYLSSSIVKKRFGNRIFSFEGEEKDVCNEYEVFAVVTHCGMLESGHYVTYLRLRNQWYRCDDAWITEVDEEVVRASQCYLMFYVQKVLYVKGSEDLGCQPLLARGGPFVPIAGCC